MELNSFLWSFMSTEKLKSLSIYDGHFLCSQTAYAHLHIFTNSVYYTGRQDVTASVSWFCRGRWTSVAYRQITLGEISPECTRTDTCSQPHCSGTAWCRCPPLYSSQRCNRSGPSCTCELCGGQSAWWPVWQKAAQNSWRWSPGALRISSSWSAAAAILCFCPWGSNGQWREPGCWERSGAGSAR